MGIEGVGKGQSYHELGWLHSVPGWNEQPGAASDLLKGGIMHGDMPFNDHPSHYCHRAWVELFAVLTHAWHGISTLPTFSIYVCLLVIQDPYD